MHFVSSALVLVSFTSLAIAAPFWGVFEQTPLTSYLTATTSSTIKSALTKAEIIPDGQLLHFVLSAALSTDQGPAIVLTKNFEPSFSLSLSYPSSHDHVFLGNVIPPSNVTSKPVFEIQALSPNPSPTVKNATYTLVLTDPDATSRSEPVKAQMCHWIVSGLKLEPKEESSQGSKTYVLKASEGVYQDNHYKGQKIGLNQLMSYVPPTPPPKTGYHRYVFVLLAPEDPKDSGKKLKKPEDRPHWGYGEEGAGVQEWADDNGLIAVGANFFYSQNKKQ